MASTTPPIPETVELPGELLMDLLADAFAAAEKIHNLSERDEYFGKYYGDQALVRYAAWAIERLPEDADGYSAEVSSVVDKVFQAAFGVTSGETIEEEDAYHRHPLLVELWARGLRKAGELREAEKIREAGTITPPGEESERVTADA